MMTRSKSIFLHSGVSALLCTLLACSSNNEHAGIEGTGDSFTATGSISTFGSIWVNGKRIQTDDAQISMESLSVIESELSAGMIVSVEGSIDSDGNYRANSVRYNTTLRGEISLTSYLEGSSDRVLTINGQDVYIADDIQFDAVSFNELSAGQFVSVSGFVKDDHLIATYVKLENNLSALIITGVIDGIDLQAMTLNINDATISYGQASIDENLPTNEPSSWVGKRVRVYFNAQNTNLSASHIELSATEINDANKKVFIEGIIHSTISANLFKVDDLEISLPESLQSKIDENFIRENQRVSIKGSLNNNGIVTAEELNFIFSGPNRLNGNIQFIDFENKSLSLSGRRIHFNELTVYNDFGPDRQRRFNFEDFALSDRLNVFAYEYQGKLYAKKIVREENSSTAKIKGRIEEIYENKNFSLLGYTVNTDALDKSSVHELIRLGEFVEVSGEFGTDNTLFASAINGAKDSCSTPERPHCREMPFPDFRDDDHDRFDHEDRDVFDPEFDFGEGIPWPDDKFTELDKDELLDFDPKTGMDGEKDSEHLSRDEQQMRPK